MGSKTLLDNRINDKGVVIRESHFGSIVSGPVQKPESENTFSDSAKNSVIAYSRRTEDRSSKRWELVCVPDRKHFSSGKRECGSKLDQTRGSRDEGPLVVELPTYKKIEGLIKVVAMKRFHNVEKNFPSKNKGVNCKPVKEVIVCVGHLEKVLEKT